MVDGGDELEWGRRGMSQPRWEQVKGRARMDDSRCGRSRISQAQSHASLSHQEAFILFTKLVKIGVAGGRLGQRLLMGRGN